MYEEDQEALAAEYVLGTLSAEEREQAEVLLSIDPTFEAAVRQWERRLGELNVMVEAVEPPAEVWDKIASELCGAAPITVAEAGLTALSAAEETVPEVTPPEASPPKETAPLTGNAIDTWTPAESLVGPPVEPRLEPRLEPYIEPRVAPRAVPSGEFHAELERELARADTPTAATIPLVAERPSAPSADVIVLAARVRRWRNLSFGAGAIAAVLAAVVALKVFAPGLIGSPSRPSAAGAGMQAAAPARAQQDRLVAVLQQGPTAPAFLVTLDTQRRSLTVRRVAANVEAGRSYELWLVSGRAPTPRSLGVIGDGEFTERTLPASVDAETLRTASYAVSLEPAGGSKSGAPSGPVLFTGKAVESLPALPPQKPATPKT